MKSTLFLLSVLCLTPFSMRGQVTVVAPSPEGKVVVVQEVRPAGRVLDPVVVQRQLSVAPRVVILPATPASVVTVIPKATIVAPPVETIQTTKTTTVVDTPGQPRRVYNSERSVVVVQEQNQTRELPYVTLPVLFEKSTADLLDTESRAALEQVAAVIIAVSRTERGTLFDIEGHTSTDGKPDYNMALSAARAQRVYDELTQRYGVPPSALSAHGYGESFPMFPKGTEEQMQHDRRVLVVRTK